MFFYLHELIFQKHIQHFETVCIQRMAGYEPGDVIAAIEGFTFYEKLVYKTSSRRWSCFVQESLEPSVLYGVV